MSGLRLSVIMLCLLAPRLGLAENPLEKAERLMEEARFKEALMIVNPLLESPNSGPEILAPAFRIRGLCLAGQGRTMPAIQAFQRFLAIRPSYRLPKSTSPKMRWPFYKALSMPGLEPISLAHKPPRAPEMLMGYPLKAEVGTNPFDMVRSVRLKYQLARGKQWITLSEPLKETGQIEFPIPAGSQDKQVWYYFEAVNRHGGTLARAGSREKPFHLASAAAEKPEPEPLPVAAKTPEKPAPPPDKPKVTIVPVIEDAPPRKPEAKPKPEPKTKPKLAVVTKPKPPPVVPLPDKKPEEDDRQDRDGAWYTTWWFWTAVGVVTAGVVTGVVLGVSGNGDSSQMIYDIVLE